MGVKIWLFVHISFPCVVKNGPSSDFVYFVVALACFIFLKNWINSEISRKIRKSFCDKQLTKEQGTADQGADPKKGIEKKLVLTYLYTIKMLRQFLPHRLHLADRIRDSDGVKLKLTWSIRAHKSPTPAERWAMKWLKEQKYEAQFLEYIKFRQKKLNNWFFPRKVIKYTMNII